MDLRVVKSKKAIREAFMDIRADTPLEKVKVKDICECSLINKSTFYAHYQDIYALSEELEEASISHMMDGFVEKALLFSDPEAFMRGWEAALDAEKGSFDVLFRGRRQQLPPRIERRFKALYLAEDATPQHEALIMFVLSGLFHSDIETKFNPDCRFTADNVTAVLKTVLKDINEPETCQKYLEHNKIHA